MGGRIHEQGESSSTRTTTGRAWPPLASTMLGYSTCTKTKKKVPQSPPSLVFLRAGGRALGREKGQRSKCPCPLGAWRCGDGRGWSFLAGPAATLNSGRKPGNGRILSYQWDLFPLALSSKMPASCPWPKSLFFLFLISFR